MKNLCINLNIKDRKKHNPKQNDRSGEYYTSIKYNNITFSLEYSHYDDWTYIKKGGRFKWEVGVIYFSLKVSKRKKDLLLKLSKFKNIKEKYYKYTDEDQNKPEMILALWEEDHMPHTEEDIDGIKWKISDICSTLKKIF